jgi:hypothetical protein
VAASTFDAAARRFTDSLNELLAKTITQHRLVGISNGAAAMIGFRQGGAPTRARLTTKYGPVNLYVGQICESKLVPGGYGVATTNYKYTLTRGDQSEPFLRWEYLKKWPHTSSRWCRHHVQGAVDLSVGAGHSVSLNDVHLASGYVTLEEVIRFCIVDLGVKPLGRTWHSTLEASYSAFKGTFPAP